MPKDRVDVQDQYKSGGTLNEFEFTQNQRALAEHEHQTPPGQTPDAEAIASLPSPLDEAERIRQVTAAAHEIVERRRAKQAGHSSKDVAAKSGANKSSAKKSAAQKSATKKSASKKQSSAKKTMAKKSAVKKASKKSTAKKSTSRNSAVAAKSGRARTGASVARKDSASKKGAGQKSKR